MDTWQLADGQHQPENVDASPHKMLEEEKCVWMSPQLECFINYQTTVLLSIPGVEQDGDYC